MLGSAVMMSGWLDETQLARRRFPCGRGNLREGSELERGEENRGCRMVASRSTDEEVGSSMPCEQSWGMPQSGYLILAQREVWLGRRLDKQREREKG